MMDQPNKTNWIVDLPIQSKVCIPTMGMKVRSRHLDVLFLIASLPAANCWTLVRLTDGHIEANDVTLGTLVDLLNSLDAEEVSE